MEKINIKSHNESSDKTELQEKILNAVDMMFAAIITLFLVPSLYMILEDIKRKISKGETR